MRILFLSNQYPPFSFGGYQQWCQEVGEAFVRRGHQVAVLTSRNRARGREERRGVLVYRRLALEIEGGLLHTTARLLGGGRGRAEAANLRQLEALVGEFQPQAALVWGMWNVPRSVPKRLEQLLPGRVAYYFCDYWAGLPDAYQQHFEHPARRTLARLPKRLLARLVLPGLRRESRPELAFCQAASVSQAVHDELIRLGAPIEHGRVIYGGTQVAQFEAVAEHRCEREPGRPLQLLVAGRLAPEKDVAVVLRALAALDDPHGRVARLDILGQGPPEYVGELRELVRRYAIQDRVRFRESVPREQMPAELARCDALVFPSRWREPLARIVLEAMASGMVVIGTRTGGTAELLREGRTGLTFPVADAGRLADQIRRLQHSPALQSQLRRAGRELVQERFTFNRMVSELEALLEQMVGRPASECAEGQQLGSAAPGNR